MPTKPPLIHLKRTWNWAAHYTAWCGAEALRLQEVTTSPTVYAAHTTCRYCAPRTLCPACLEAWEEYTNKAL